VLGSLKKWSAKVFGAVRNKILILERGLKAMRCADVDGREIQTVEKELCELFERDIEKTLWHVIDLEWIGSVREIIADNA
jgi:hypothetical protein